MSLKSFSFTSEHQAWIDPRIQDLENQSALNGKIPKFHSAKENEIPVIAKVKNLATWKGVEYITSVPEIRSRDGWIVTGRMPLSKVRSYRKWVDSLKTTQPIKPTLYKTIEKIGLSEDFLKSFPGLSGSGVVIGIVDFGCDFAHRNFIRGNGTSRVSWIWDQGAEAIPGKSTVYGREYSQDDINNALKTDAPYTTLGYGPRKGAHGTHVMDIAAGNGEQKGVASDAEIVFVDLSTIPYDGIEEVAEKDFGDSIRIIEAVDYIFRKAGDKPCVVNLSLGTNGGPHDGTNPVEQALDSIVEEKPNRAVVIAASNSYEDHIHVSGEVEEGNYIDLKWSIPFMDHTKNEVEIWYHGEDEFSLEVIDPKYQLQQKIELGSSKYITRKVDETVERLAFICHRGQDPNNNDNVIHIVQDPVYSPLGGEWTLRLHGQKIKKGGAFHAWIERDDSAPSKFEKADSRSTLGSISCGVNSIVVASYNAHEEGDPISAFSSAGPTRDGRPKPELSAPGGNVEAANAKTTNGIIAMSGTSMAAPAVTGMIGLMFELAAKNEYPLQIKETRELLTSHTRIIEGKAWDERYGFGSVSTQALVELQSRVKRSKEDPYMTTNMNELDEIIEPSNSDPYMTPVSLDSIISSTTKTRKFQDKS